MDCLKDKRACASYRIMVSVEQVERYKKVIEDQNRELVTHMNCKMNSVGATLRQVCKHINNKTLFSYEEDYTIGC